MNAIQFSENTRVPNTPVADRSQRTELARAARREVILDAARRVFAERGFRGTTIADIAEEAHIALGTIYLYFASKEDVFAALNQRLAEIIAGAINDGVADTSLAESVRRRVANVFDVCAANRDLVQLVVLNTDPESAVTRRLREAEKRRNQPMVGTLDVAVRAGLIRKGDARVMAGLIQGLMYSAVYQAFVLSDGSYAERYRDACADMILAYLTPST